MCTKGNVPRNEARVICIVHFNQALSLIEVFHTIYVSLNWLISFVILIISPHFSWVLFIQTYTLSINLMVALRAQYARTNLVALDSYDYTSSLFLFLVSKQNSFAPLDCSPHHSMRARVTRTYPASTCDTVVRQIQIRRSACLRPSKAHKHQSFSLPILLTAYVHGRFVVF